MADYSDSYPQLSGPPQPQPRLDVLNRLIPDYLKYQPPSPMPLQGTPEGKIGPPSGNPPWTDMAAQALPDVLSFLSPGAGKLGGAALGMASGFWKPEREALLRQLAAKGKSLTEMAGELGTTRGAVAGKMDRLDMSTGNPVGAPGLSNARTTVGNAPTLPKLNFMEKPFDPNEEIKPNLPILPRWGDEEVSALRDLHKSGKAPSRYSAEEVEGLPGRSPASIQAKLRSMGLSVSTGNTPGGQVSTEFPYDSKTMQLIRQLSDQGKGYGAIAKELGIDSRRKVRTAVGKLKE